MTDTENRDEPFMTWLVDQMTDAVPPLLVPTKDEVEWQREDLAEKMQRAAEKAACATEAVRRASDTAKTAAVAAIATYLRTLDAYDPDDDCLPFDQEDVWGVPLWRPVPAIAAELYALAHGPRP